METKHARSVVIFELFYLIHHIAMVYVAYSSVLPKVFSVEDEILSGKIKNAWAFISIWNFVFQIIYFLLALTQQFLVKSERTRHELAKWSGYVFSAFVFPFGLLVFTAFWSLYIFKKELLAPVPILELLDLHVQIGVHLVILFPLATEVIVAKPMIPDHRSAVLGMSVALVTYFLVLEFVHSVFGIWMYTLLEYLSVIDRIVVAVVLYALTLIYFKIGYFFQKSWNKSNKQKL